jgi:hypothetical protein
MNIAKSIPGELFDETTHHLAQSLPLGGPQGRKLLCVSSALDTHLHTRQGQRRAAEIKGVSRRTRTAMAAHPCSGVLQYAACACLGYWLLAAGCCCLLLLPFSGRNSPPPCH